MISRRSSQRSAWKAPRGVSRSDSRVPSDTTKESFNMTQEWREFIEQQQNATITQLRTENQNLKAAMADKERAMADKERNLKQALRDQGWSEERIRTLFGET